jgi:hypothetical protein
MKNNNNLTTTNANETTKRFFDAKTITIFVLSALLMIAIVMLCGSIVANASTETQTTIETIEVPVYVDRVKYIEVEKEIEVPVTVYETVEVEKIVTEIIEVPVTVVETVEVEKVVEKIVEVPVVVEKVVEKIEYVDRVEYVDRTEYVYIEDPNCTCGDEEHVVTPEVVRYTTFDLPNGKTFTAYWNNNPAVEEIIHDILNYMIEVTFTGDGNSMTLTITGSDVVFYADRIEYKGEVVATTSCEIIDGTIGVVQMFTQK